MDSTGPHNRSWSESHGLLTYADLSHIDARLNEAPRGAVCIIVLHHHLLPLPADTFLENLAKLIGHSSGAELSLGTILIKLALGRCHMILHGHRHVPHHRCVAAQQNGEQLPIYSAGDSATLARLRVFTHSAGKIIGTPRWIFTRPSKEIHHRPTAPVEYYL